MRDITPVVGDPVESECGAYVAVFAEWFLTERTGLERARRAIPGFRERVQVLMRSWRADR